MARRDGSQERWAALSAAIWHDVPCGTPEKTPKEPQKESTALPSAHAAGGAGDFVELLKFPFLPGWLSVRDCNRLAASTELAQGMPGQAEASCSSVPFCLSRVGLIECACFSFLQGFARGLGFCRPGSCAQNSSSCAAAPGGSAHGPRAEHSTEACSLPW